ncbi:hypothetical protein [Streptomyces sp. NPDC014733]|uniref:hypothetical protein n=1 Tax=Streptomyces sp. NPDC014733 TaxID=3364885 RepID=UPI003700659A
MPGSDEELGQTGEMPDGSAPGPEGSSGGFWARAQAVIAAVGGAVGAVAGVVGLVFLLVPGLQPEAAKGIELVDSDVDREENIRADFTTPDSPPGRINMRASMLSVTLRNTSDDPVLVTDAVFHFSSAEELKCTSGAGGTELRAQYNIKVPNQGGTSFSVKRKMKYTVPPHRQERVAFSLGPEVEWSGNLPYIYTFDVALHADDDVRIDVPEATMIVTPDLLESYLENARRAATEGLSIPEPGCIRKEAEAVRKVVAEAKRPSPELREFSAELTRIAQRI